MNRLTHAARRAATAAPAAAHRIAAARLPVASARAPRAFGSRRWMSATAESAAAAEAAAAAAAEAETAAAFEYSLAGESGGQAKENQDTTLVARLGAGLSVFAVLDGHGQAGATVSQFCAEFLRDKLSAELPAAVAAAEGRKGALDELLVRTFLETDTALQSALQGYSALQFDGSTCCVVVRDGSQLTIAALGDSRAVLGKRGGGAAVLTQDHTPVRESEKRRIEAAGGRVDVFPDEPSMEERGKGRVFLADEMYPGLAVARAFGDLIAKTVGVTAEPEMSARTLGADDALLLIASDGLWDVLSPKEAVAIAGEHLEARDAVLASADLVDAARARWEAQKLEFISLGGNPGDWSIDDISAVAVFL